MTALRKLLLGETWTLPLGITAIAVAAICLDSVAGSWWTDLGGFALLAVSVLLLCATTQASAPRRATEAPRPDEPDGE